MNTNTDRSWDDITRNEYRAGHKNATDEELDLMVEAEHKAGRPMDSIEEARKVMSAPSEAPAVAPAPAFDPAALVAVVGKVVDEKLAANATGRTLAPGTRFEVAERDASGRAKAFKVSKE